jgi:hypothetical protein
MTRHSPPRRWRAARWRATGWRAAVAFAVAAVCASTAAVASAGTGPSSGSASFAADSRNLQAGDVCPMGFTKGQFTWDSPTAVIEVTGSVVDRPFPGDTTRCADDRRFSEVTFTSYTNGTVSSVTTRAVDNGTLPFTFPVPWSQAIVVQVCRYSTPPDPDEDYCGRPHEIPIPIINP